MAGYVQRLLDGGGPSAAFVGPAHRPASPLFTPDQMVTQAGGLETNISAPEFDGYRTGDNPGDSTSGRPSSGVPGISPSPSPPVFGHTFGQPLTIPPSVHDVPDPPLAPSISVPHDRGARDPQSAFADFAQPSPAPPAAAPAAIDSVRPAATLAQPSGPEAPPLPQNFAGPDNAELHPRISPILNSPEALNTNPQRSADAVALSVEMQPLDSAAPRASPAPEVQPILPAAPDTHVPRSRGVNPAVEAPAIVEPAAHLAAVRTADEAPPAPKIAAEPSPRRPMPLPQPVPSAPDWQAMENRIREQVLADLAKTQKPPAEQLVKTDASDPASAKPPSRPMTAAEASVIGKIGASSRPIMIFGTRIR